MEYGYTDHGQRSKRYTSKKQVMDDARSISERWLRIIDVYQYSTIGSPILIATFVDGIVRNKYSDFSVEHYRSA